MEQKDKEQPLRDVVADKMSATKKSFLQCRLSCFENYNRYENAYFEKLSKVLKKYKKGGPKQQLVTEINERYFYLS